MESGGNICAFLHLPPGKGSAFPVVMMCGSLDNLQSDYCRYFRDYLAPQGIALLTLDMPSIGYSSKQTLGRGKQPDAPAGTGSAAQCAVD